MSQTLIPKFRCPYRSSYLLPQIPLRPNRQAKLATNTDNALVDNHNKQTVKVNYTTHQFSLNHTKTNQAYSKPSGVIYTKKFIPPFLLFPTAQTTKDPNPEISLSLSVPWLPLLDSSSYTVHVDANRSLFPMLHFHQVASGAARLWQK